MLHHNVNFPNVAIRDAYLVFVPLTPQPIAFNNQTKAVNFAAAEGGFVVEASQVSRIRHNENVSAEEAKERVHVLKLEE